MATAKDIHCDGPSNDLRPGMCVCESKSMHDPDGLAASRLQLPSGPWATVLECLCARFPAIAPETWRDRFARGRVLDVGGLPLSVDAPYRSGAEIRYFREVADEATIPFDEVVLHVDAHLVVVDKPHFLPVVPAGRYARETLLARLVRRLGNPNLVPLHRIDRDTAGLVLFSADPATRDAYQSLFRLRRIQKRYEALAAPLPGLAFPRVHRSRLGKGEPFFRMREVDGEPNSETRIDVIERMDACWRYALEPVTGRKHQLRVHMRALGAPILNDRVYSEGVPAEDRSFTHPLKLLARSLAFIDPLGNELREFESARSLDP